MIHGSSEHSLRATMWRGACVSNLISGLISGLSHRTISSETSLQRIVAAEHRVSLASSASLSPSGLPNMACSQLHRSRSVLPKGAARLRRAWHPAGRAALFDPLLALRQPERESADRPVAGSSDEDRAEDGWRAIRRTALPVGIEATTAW